MINIVIPMAGLGSRFSKSGYSVPKPLIEIGNKTMIETVINNLTPDRQHKLFLFAKFNMNVNLIFHLY